MSKSKATRVPTLPEVEHAARSYLAAADDAAYWWRPEVVDRGFGPGEEARFAAAGDRERKAGKRLAAMLRAANMPAVVVDGLIVADVLGNCPMAEAIEADTGYVPGNMVVAIPLAGLGLRPAGAPSSN